MLKTMTPEQYEAAANAFRYATLQMALDALDSPDAPVTGASRVETRCEIMWEMALIEGMPTPERVNLAPGENPVLFPRIWRVLVRNRYRDGQATAFCYYNREG